MIVWTSPTSFVVNGTDSMFDPTPFDTDKYEWIGAPSKMEGRSYARAVRNKLTGEVACRILHYRYLYAGGRRIECEVSSEDELYEFHPSCGVGRALINRLSAPRNEVQAAWRKACLFYGEMKSPVCSDKNAWIKCDHVATGHTSGDRTVCSAEWIVNKTNGVKGRIEYEFIPFGEYLEFLESGKRYTSCHALGRGLPDGLIDYVLDFGENASEILKRSAVRCSTRPRSVFCEKQASQDAFEWLCAA